MSFLTDLRTVSASMIEQVAGRFPDLPEPLLAAIGAGDMAVERLAELRDSLEHSAPGAGDLRDIATDLPGRAQKAVADVTASLEKFATDAPAKAQHLISELPAKAQEVGQSLTPDTVRQTIEAYTQLAGVIYGNLAKRGGHTWSHVRDAGLTPGTVVAPAKVTADPTSRTEPTAPAKPRSRTVKPSSKAAANTAPAESVPDSTPKPTSARTSPRPTAPATPTDTPADS